MMKELNAETKTTMKATVAEPIEEGSSTAPMGKLDSILFESDKGPASALFRKGGIRTSDDAEVEPGISRAVPASVDTPNEELKKSKSSDQIGNPTADSSAHTKAVSFVSKENTGENFTSPGAMDKLKQKLNKAYDDLASERSNRKRKEKSLVKLAKQLNSRAEDAAAKDTKIVEMEETVTDLEHRLADRNKELITYVPKLKAQCKQQSTALAEYEETAQKQAIVLSEYEDTTQKLKEKLGETEQKVAVLMEQIDDQEQQQQKSKKSPASNNNASLLGFLVVFLAALAIAIPHGALASDGLCAPIKPGTMLNGTSDIAMSAPWWAPDAYKDIAFAICAGRPPMKLLAYGNGKFEVTSPSRSEWHGKAPKGLSVDGTGRKLFLHKRGGQVEEIVAPWV